MFCSIQHAGEVKNDPQARANDYVVDFEDPSLGKIKIPGYPIHFSACSRRNPDPGPETGGTHVIGSQEKWVYQPEIDSMMASGGSVLTLLFPKSSAIIEFFLKKTA
jgi:crotonobetainyl-CoA:carnitine CoA-transferase CaiB-like acyl-CoA transferase